MTKTKELEPVMQVANGVAHGFRPMLTTRTVVADPDAYPQLRPADGMEPFTAEISDQLTMAEQKRIPVSGPWPPILQMIAPWVVSWNAGKLNGTTGEWEVLPPPAEAGWEVLEEVSAHVCAFLTICLKRNVGGDLPKGSSNIGDMGDG